MKNGTNGGSRPFPLVPVAVAVAALVTLAIVLSVAIALSVGGDDRPEPEPIFFDAAAIEVDISDFHYIVAIISVPAGATITWTNYDTAPHTATAGDDEGSWGTGVLQENESTALSFDTPGTYHYYCTLHPHMHGEITVRPPVSD